MKASANNCRCTECKVNKKQLGLALGIFGAAIHAVWALTIALGFGQGLLDWVLPLHFLNNVYSVLPFSMGNMVMLIVMAFVCCYAMGWLFGALWNYLGEQM